MRKAHTHTYMHRHKAYKNTKFETTISKQEMSKVKKNCPNEAI